MKPARYAHATLLRLLFLAVVLHVLLPLTSYAYYTEVDPEGSEKQTQPEEVKYFDVELELDAYYTNLEFYIALTKTPIPHVGEKSEKGLYMELLSRALSPRFLYLEASVNPMPYLGVAVKKHNRDFYDDAQVSGSFNWVKALTAGFEEPYAGSVFFGHLVDFDTPGSKETKGKGFTGFLFSAGAYHIKDNALVEDNWREIEWKIKGDWKSPIKKLSWSYRIGAKLHENPYVSDIIYLSVRRSRLDYKPERSSLFNNSGFEYTFDMATRTFEPIRHYFYVDKKWPFEGGKTFFALAVGFVWESAKKYSGPLVEGREKENFQIILRPNIEF